MITQWFNHLKTDEEQNRFKQQVESARAVLERQTQLIQQEEDGLVDAELNPKFYDTPNWDYKQAYTNGFKAGLRFTKKLNNLDQRKQ